MCFPDDFPDATAAADDVSCLLCVLLLRRECHCTHDDVHYNCIINVRRGHEAVMKLTSRYYYYYTYILKKRNLQ